LRCSGGILWLLVREWRARRVRLGLVGSVGELRSWLLPEGVQDVGQLSKGRHGWWSRRVVGDAGGTMTQRGFKRTRDTNRGEIGEEGGARPWACIGNKACVKATGSRRR
jgi:hypothetical protein